MDEPGQGHVANLDGVRDVVDHVPLAHGLVVQKRGQPGRVRLAAQEADGRNRVRTCVCRGLLPLTGCLHGRVQSLLDVVLNGHLELVGQHRRIAGPEDPLPQDLPRGELEALVRQGFLELGLVDDILQVRTVAHLRRQVQLRVGGHEQQRRHGPQRGARALRRVAVGHQPVDLLKPELEALGRRMLANRRRGQQPPLGTLHPDKQLAGRLVAADHAPIPCPARQTVVVLLVRVGHKRLEAPLMVGLQHVGQGPAAAAADLRISVLQSLGQRSLGRQPQPPQALRGAVALLAGRVAQLPHQRGQLLARGGRFLGRPLRRLGGRSRRRLGRRSLRGLDVRRFRRLGGRRRLGTGLPRRPGRLGRRLGFGAPPCRARPSDQTESNRPTSYPEEPAIHGTSTSVDAPRAPLPRNISVSHACGREGSRCAA